MLENRTYYYSEQKMKALGNTLVSGGLNLVWHLKIC